MLTRLAAIVACTGELGVTAVERVLVERLVNTGNGTALSKEYTSVIGLYDHELSATHLTEKAPTVPEQPILLTKWFVSGPMLTPPHCLVSVLPSIKSAPN